MKVIDNNGMAKQINAEGRGKLLPISLNLSFTVVEVLSGDRIVAEEPASTTNPGEDVTHCDFVGIEDFTASKPIHSTLPEQ